MPLSKKKARENGAKGGKARKGFKSNHTLKAIAARARLIDRIHEDMDVLYDAWKDAAVGHFIEKEVMPGSGIMKIYQKGPNPMAIKDLVDRAMGKPVQPIDSDGKDPLDLSKRANDLAKPFLNPTDEEDT